MTWVDPPEGPVNGHCPLCGGELDVDYDGHASCPECGFDSGPPEPEE